MRPVKTINISAGGRGRLWVGWARQAGADIVGLVDIDPAKLAAAGEALDIPPEARFTSISAAAAATGAEAAIACTPNPVHAQVAREALDAGLHILIEKPMTESIDEARELVRRAADKGLQLAVAQQQRFVPANVAVKRMIDAGALGHIAALNVQFHRWRPSKGLALPLLLNQGIHHLDTVRFVLGQNAVSCLAHLWNPEWNDCDGPTVAEITYRMSGGTIFHYSGSYVSQGKAGPYSGSWRIEGSTGRLTCAGDGGAARITLTRLDAETEEDIDIPDRGTNAQIPLCRNFMHAVQTGTPAAAAGTDNLYSLAMIFAAAKSSRLRREVPVLAGASPCP